jgi:CDP-paratose 2-epimerase
VRERGVRLLHGDIRNPSDLDDLPAVDWVIDAAANPSVLAGVSGRTSSRQLMEHNLAGTLHLLEYCKRHRAGFVMLSTSRVYSLARLAALPMQSRGEAFVPRVEDATEPGLSADGVAETFSTEPPLSLYGAAKLASEVAAREYGLAFDFRVIVDRCGVLAGSGQFGKPDQGIFAYWIHSYCRRRPLTYIGFGGSGHQVRDCLDPRDLTDLLARQLRRPPENAAVFNVAGGAASATSLAQLSHWCAARFGARPIAAQPAGRPYDVPWLVLDAGRARAQWDWRPQIPAEQVFREIADHAEAHPDWLDLSADA